MFENEGTEGGVCTSIRCTYNKLKPKATWLNTQERRWVCFQCAQEANRTLMQQRLKYGGLATSPVCIPAQEYTFRLLSSNLSN